MHNMHTSHTDVAGLNLDDSLLFFFNQRKSTFINQVHEIVSCGEIWRLTPNFFISFADKCATYCRFVPIQENSVKNYIPIGRGTSAKLSASYASKFQSQLAEIWQCPAWVGNAGVTRMRIASRLCSAWQDLKITPWFVCSGNETVDRHRQLPVYTTLQSSVQDLPIVISNIASLPTLRTKNASWEKCRSYRACSGRNTEEVLLTGRGFNCWNLEQKREKG